MEISEIEVKSDRGKANRILLTDNMGYCFSVNAWTASLLAARTRGTVKHLAK